MKKMFLLLFLCFSLITMSSCSSKEIKSLDNPIENDDSSMFIEIERTPCWIIVCHKETKIMYSVSYGAYNYGTFTVLVDENGKPLTYDAICK